MRYVVALGLALWSLVGVAADSDHGPIQVAAGLSDGVVQPVTRRDHILRAVQDGLDKYLYHVEDVLMSTSGGCKIPYKTQAAIYFKFAEVDYYTVGKDYVSLKVRVVATNAMGQQLFADLLSFYAQAGYSASGSIERLTNKSKVAWIDAAENKLEELMTPRLRAERTDAAGNTVTTSVIAANFDKDLKRSPESHYANVHTRWSRLKTDISGRAISDRTKIECCNEFPVRLDIQGIH